MNLIFLMFIDVLTSMGCLAKYMYTLPIWGSFTLQATQCSLHFDNSRKNEIYSIVEYVDQMYGIDYIVCIYQLQPISVKEFYILHRRLHNI